MELYEIVKDNAPIVTGILALLLSYVLYRWNKRQNRINNLKLVSDRLAKERALYSERALLLEKKRKIKRAMDQNFDYTLAYSGWNLGRPIFFEKVKIHKETMSEFCPETPGYYAWCGSWVYVNVKLFIKWVWFHIKYSYWNRCDGNKSADKLHKPKLYEIPHKIFGNLPYDLPYSNNLQKVTSKELKSADAYVLTNIYRDCDGEVHLNISTCDYTEFIDTCDALAYELASTYYCKGELRNDITPIDVYKLPYRCRVTPYYFTNRFVGIGINTLTIVNGFKDTNHVYFLMHKRGDKTAEGQNSYHVVPAGTYQPIERFSSTQETDDIFYPEDTIVKEFMEEILDIGKIGDIASLNLLKKMKTHLNASYIYLGTVLDPLTLKAEMMACMVLDVSCSDIFRNHRTKTEFERIITNNYEGELFMLPFTDDFLGQYMENDNSIPVCREILKIAKTKQFQELVSVKRDKVSELSDELRSYFDDLIKKKLDSKTINKK